MDECHITLFDPWFRRGIRDRPKHFLGHLNYLGMVRGQPQRSSIVRTKQQIKYYRYIQLNPNLSTPSPLSALIVRYLQQAVASINKFPAPTR